MARYYRRRRRKDDTPETLLFLGVLTAAGLYGRLSAQDINLLISALLLLPGVILALVLFIQIKRTRHAKEKLRALNLVDTHYMDGLAFEKYVVELMKSQGYARVTLTERYDYGIDIVALKDGVRWGVQVKRYSNMVKAEAVRQVVTALNKYNCQRAMVVTNSTYSRPAKVLAESNNCVLIAKDELAEWILAFQKGGYRNRASATRELSDSSPDQTA